jgi:thioredoxin-related protein
MSGRSLLLLCGAAAAVYFLFFHAPPVPHDDYQGALALAAEKNRLVLLDFTGSDWCPACMKLDEEVFSQPEFREYARENLEMVVVDFPRTKPQKPDVREQNELLRERFGVHAYPTLILVNARGREIARRVGYLPGGPRAFRDWVDSVR